MSRTGDKYWNNEPPVVQEINGKMVLHYYQMAGVLQFYNIWGRNDDGSAKLSKGVVIHLDQTPLSEIEQLFECIKMIMHLEAEQKRKESPKPSASRKAPPPTRSFTELAQEVGEEV